MILALKCLSMFSTYLVICLHRLLTGNKILKQLRPCFSVVLKKEDELVIVCEERKSNGIISRPQTYFSAHRNRSHLRQPSFNGSSEPVCCSCTAERLLFST